MSFDIHTLYSIVYYVHGVHSCQPVMTKKKDKILKEVGFSVKKEGQIENIG